MQGSVVRVTLSLIGPGIIGVFGCAFLAAWSYERRRPYLGILAAACALFALGASSQIIYWPRDTGLNAMVSGALYTCAVIATVEGVLIRSGRAFGLWIDVAIFAGFSLALWFFFYVDRSLLARIYVQNFGYGLLLCAAALRLSRLRRGRVVDRILFWTLFLFGLHFFPRTVFTVGVSPPAGELAFADSVFWQTLQLSLAVLGAALAMAILAAAVSDLMDDLRRERDLDHLTGLLNRRGFEAEIAAPMHRAPEGVSLILCDVDHFKSINDTFGHAVGDVVLKEIGAILRRTARKGDLIGRLGGEEFAVFLPDASLSDAYECAERLRQTIANSQIPGLGNRSVTASFGVATIQEAGDWAALYKMADSRLYRAKASGRDQTVDRGV
ncbi:MULTISPECIES: GGDEF domain-containing protein [Rhodopseudomonas]|uniref:diguanylate cyclase n=1 Tax=Rhodopseudomonas palustris TaxID=1076 RepID=A0A0D7ELU3_RHOPL|nr:MULTISPECIES: GGDEF domain-containing protein [Rhodopseudomonas]KIZ41784.1 diguanylate cyclase [Rhodopseudomonas palustris]WOK19214.1 GGDEF domain-containing protein [Rhodopseudomonas sp. BAL398]